ncbi:MAG: response regulator [Methylococcales bacterium]|nr:response regulator [Methylococcales bacterium]
MSTNLNVKLINCPPEDEKKLKKIFHLSSSRDRVYNFLDESSEITPDLAIIDIDTESSTINQQQLQQKHPDIQIVTKSKSSSDNTHHIQGALLATRVLRTLDKLVFTDSDKSDGQITNSSVIEEQNSKSFNVLVVDDSPLMQKTIGMELDNAPIKINTEYADNGEQALAMTEQKLYDFIFLDVMMPGIDGYETCTAIRKKTGMKKIPIIMLSAKTSPMDEVKGVMAGCSTYLTKPIEHESFQQLLERVMSWLKDFKQNRK